jgi:hypothetical protein
MMMIAAAEWSGALFGLLGSFLLATHSKLSRYGWIAYLAANVAMLVFASAISAYGLLVQQIGFTATTLLGMHRAGFLTGPRVRKPSVKATEGAI